jgi:hypothetical protein
MEVDCLSCWTCRAELSDVEGLGKKREPGGLGDSMDGVEGFVDGAVEGAKASAKGDGAEIG